jgi:hypothetical protein
MMYMQCAEYNRLKNVVFGDLGRVPKGGRVGPRLRRGGIEGVDQKNYCGSGIGQR